MLRYQISFWLCLAGNLSRAGQPLYDEYRVENGLQSNTVYCVAQDNQGFIWLGTDAGVCRFDGISFTCFTIDDGLCDNEVLRIKQDRSGRIWFMSLSGCLAYYHDGTIHSARDTPWLDSRPNTLGLTGMLEDSRGRLWVIGIGQQVGLIESNSLRWIDIQPELSSPYRRGFVEVYEDESGQILFFRADGLTRWNSGNPVRDDSFPHKKIYRNCFVSDGRQGAYMLTEEGIIHYDGGRLSVVIDRNIFQVFGDIQGMFLAGDDLWISDYSGGVGRLDQTTGLYRQEKIFPESSINFVFSDRDNNIWIATKDSGVRCITHEQQHCTRVACPGQITCMKKDPAGNLWLASEEGVLYRLISGQFVQVCALPRPARISSVHFDNGKIYLCAYSGVYSVEVRAGVAPQVTGNLSSTIPKDIAIDDQHRLYMLTLSGIEVLDLRRTGALPEGIPEIPSARRYHLCAASDSTLWFEEHDKLFYFRGGRMEAAHVFNAGAYARISGIEEMPDGTLLVATLGDGITFLRNGTVVGRVNEAGGLCSNVCEQVRVSGDTCWAITPNGISRFSVRMGNACGMQAITAGEGLPSGKITDVAALGETCWLAMQSGLIQFNSAQRPAIMPPPEPVIVGLLSEGTPVNTATPLKHGAGLTIRYSVPTYYLALRNKYEYRINAGNWIETGSRTIEFSPPGGGNHTVEIRARRHSSGWGPPVALAFTVNTPLWAKPWFMALSLAPVSLSLAWLVRFRIRRKYRRRVRQLEGEQALLAERNRISTDLHDDLGAELSNIVILTRIAKSKLQLSEDRAAPVDRIDKAASETISKMSSIIWALNPANDSLDNLADYIRRYAYEFMELHHLEGAVQCNHQPGDSEVKGIVRRNVFLIVKEALHNVFKHSGAKRVDIRLWREGNTCCVSVTDNGKGIPETFAGTGLGMSSMRRRAADMGGELTLTTPPGGGCCVQLKWPLTNN